LKNFKVLILLFKNQFTPSCFCPHAQTFRSAIPTSTRNQTLTELLKGKRGANEGLFAKVRAEWETLVALGALAPCGQAFRPNRLKTSP